ncbi:MAG: hypothetical protein LUI87_02215 [Lachnospiraceae bacterium]|nr:hypothetical protein [Lachnospiraceae bacterium]
MKCPNCGKEFTALTVIQKYCSTKCGYQYRKIHPPEYPSITFDCANCGKKVVTDGIRDKRSRFCCAECEKKYWKHRPWDETNKRRDSGSARMQFHSVEEYASWERRTNT